ncbi:MAG TPA: fenitrothion hydrolase [Solirubrobacteraceae bacterium]|nr:fenitrothion hydrolase [Solirubrobacteraceae bacterium]
MTPRAARRQVAALLVAVAAALSLPATASAHGIAQRADLPVPEWLFAWAAAFVLLVSFVALAILWPRPVLEQARERLLLRVPGALEVLAGAFGVFAFAAVVYAGFAGTQTATANLAPTVIFVLFWVGIPFLTMFVGDVFAAVSPWRAVGRAAGWLATRVGRAQLPEPLAYPARVGRWPAALGILLFAWVELVYVNRDQPSVLATMAVAYAVVMLVGQSLYGVEAWTRNADAFGVAFGLFARLAPLHWRERHLYLRPVLVGAPRMPTGPGAVAVVCVMIGTTTFDGFSQGAVWLDPNGLAARLTSVFHGLGLGPEAAPQGAYTVGLVVVVLIVAGLYRLGIAGMRTVGRDHTTNDLARRFAHSLIPIALAYVVAHYFSLLAYQGQAIAYLASDPLGNGSNLLGTASATIDYGIVGGTGIWYVQVAALVAGHVAGLTLAHDRALSIWRDPRIATRSQYWMLLVMVTFTCLGLWLLSAASR